ncbi:ABC-2 type transport system permease protein [Actinoplanes tereljensis]|uniref:Exporter of polyketide antibiotics n=1 Tax=Paractinoplanes tereljensis TaxID=571912 RepID=A0A919NL38_9ACTN|nr:ABC transporter permease [Actinoplanes tereljensis]GIF19632.1 exporter of polyketide antibiotics [Actinoplanes tereljensis]
MTGTAKLIRLILRRDRIVLPLWILLFGLLGVGTYASFEGLFPTDAERIQFASVSTDNAGLVALYGLLQGDSLAVLTSWRVGFVPMVIGLAALLTVIRHTRADEEAGRTELLGATVVGRHAQLAAALIVTATASVLIGLLTFVSMAGKTGNTGGSLAFGAELTVSGLMFAAVAAITAQLTSSARSARSIAVVVLGVAYALRVGGDISAIGDGGLTWLSWVSPLGWVTHIFPYGPVNWWPVVMSVLAAAIATNVAVELRKVRDLGDGLVASRLGPANAPAGLGHPLGLAWRLHRGLLLGWTAGFALLGLIFGGVGGSVLDIAESNQGLTDIFDRLAGGNGAGQLLDSYFAGIAGTVGLIAACYGVQATLRLRDEETAGHAEAVLTTSVSRFAWAASHLLFALLGPALALFAEGLVSGLVATDGNFGRILGGTMLQLPAVWVLAGLTVLLFGLLPRLSLVAWAAPVICVLVLLVGQTLQASQWLLDISPFTHVPHLTGGTVSATPVITLLVVAAALAAAGLFGLRRRNLPD